LELGWASIRHRELIGLLWTKDDYKGIHPDIGGAAHVTRLIYNTNKRISWIASEIIYYGVYLGPLSDAIEYFIKVGEILLSKNNFGTLFQIINALGEEY
jgi:hypothetical protein